MSALELLEPHGAGNDHPLVELRQVTLAECRPIGRDGAHLRLKLRDNDGRVVEAIGFGLAEQHQGLGPGDVVTVRGNLNNNEYQGRSAIQLVVAELVSE
jgi:single-stranded-DNA-specific exonuclease